LHAFDVNAAVTNLKEAAHLVPADKLAILNQAVLASCDALDGVKNGLLNNPHLCKNSEMVHHGSPFRVKTGWTLMAAPEPWV
jgi:hypothetical protein